MKLYTPCHLTELLGHPEFMRGGSVLVAQSTIALPIGSVFGQPRSELGFQVVKKQKRGSVDSCQVGT